MINELNMLHGYDYRHTDNVRGWLMSEKLNGCRAYWDGETMWTRGGKIINIPDDMRAVLPAYALDGEIYAGVDGFQVARVAVQYGKFVEGVQFVAFDAPFMDGPFSERYEFIKDSLPMSGVVCYAEHDLIYHIDTAVDFMRVIQSNGGEGVILRSPAGFYIAGRSLDVLKLKEWP